MVRIGLSTGQRVENLQVRAGFDRRFERVACISCGGSSSICEGAGYRVSFQYDEPTVEFAVDLRVPLAGQRDGWAWRQCSVMPVSNEFIYTHEELCRALRIYALLASRAIPGGKYAGFRITVHGLPARCMLAQYEWRWEPYAALYVPDGAPWCSWPKASELPWHVRRGAAHFEPPTGIRPPIDCGEYGPGERKTLRLVS